MRLQKSSQIKADPSLATIRITRPVVTVESTRMMLKQVTTMKRGGPVGADPAIFSPLPTILRGPICSSFQGSMNYGRIPVDRMVATVVATHGGASTQTGRTLWTHGPQLHNLQASWETDEKTRKYLTKYLLLCRAQQAFIKWRSCTSNLVGSSVEVRARIDEVKYFEVCDADFSRVFVSVNPGLRMKSPPFRNRKVLDFLANRSVWECETNLQSNWAPQWPVTGPLLSLLHINALAA